MARVIWKYPIPGARFSLRMPPGRVVHVGLGPDHRPSMWVEVEPDAEAIDRSFYVAGTGHPLLARSEHAGTYVEGPFVWHVYEVTP